MRRIVIGGFHRSHLKYVISMSYCGCWQEGGRVNIANGFHFGVNARIDLTRVCVRIEHALFHLDSQVFVSDLDGRFQHVVRRALVLDGSVDLDDVHGGFEYVGRVQQGGRGVHDLVQGDLQVGLFGGDVHRLVSLIFGLGQQQRNEFVVLHRVQQRDKVRLDGRVGHRFDVDRDVDGGFREFGRHDGRALGDVSRHDGRCAIRPVEHHDVRVSGRGGRVDRHGCLEQRGVLREQFADEGFVPCTTVGRFARRGAAQWLEVVPVRTHVRLYFLKRVGGARMHRNRVHLRTFRITLYIGLDVDVSARGHIFLIFIFMIV